MIVVAAILFVLAPWTVSIAAPGFDAEAQALYVELFRICRRISQVLFAGVDGPRRGPRRPPPLRVLRRRRPLLYNAGHRRRHASLLADRIGIQAAAVGAILGATPHAGMRLVGVLTRTTYRPRLRLELRTAAAARVLPADAAQDRCRSPIEPITFLFFTSVASSARRRQHHDGQPGPELPERADQPHRRRPSRWPPSRPSPRPTPPATGAGSSARSARRGLTIGVLTVGGRDRPDHRRPVRPSTSCWAAAASMPRPSPGPRSSCRCSPSPSRSRASGTCSAGPSTRPTTRCSRSWPRSSGSSSPSAATLALVDRIGRAGHPGGYALGVIVRFVAAGHRPRLAAAPDARRSGRAGPCGQPAGRVRAPSARP